MSGGRQPRLGISGRSAAAFQANPLTPLLALAGLMLGLLAVLVTPREEEPQIDVTMANVFVALPGASSGDVERLVATPLEHHLSAIEGVKHVYSTSLPGRAVITVEFDVGVPREDAVVRLYNQVYSHADWAPQALGASPPLVRPMGIDDVPIMALTLWTDDPDRGAADLAEVARALETELKRVPGTRDVYTIGAPQRAVLVELDAGRLARHGLGVDELGQALAAANVVRHAGDRIGADGTRPLTTGSWLADADDVAELVIGVADGRPLQLSDVATVHRGADLPVAYVWHGAPVHQPGPDAGIAPALTLAISKLPGSNASDITEAIGERVAALHGTLIPDGIEVAASRDYGRTASDKAGTLIAKLLFATMTVVLLVLFALGWREAVVVGSAVVLTLALTLFASWAMGFTINRVSLFALIFSIGILVDDAIVVVENIHRHMHRGGRTLLQAIPPAVDEVGSPTILATFTVIAALLPMAFVSGLMGPYMRPIPINASVGMLLSLLIALTVTPWLSWRLLSRRFATTAAAAPQALAGDAHDDAAGGWLQRFFDRLLRPFLDPGRGAVRRRLLFAAIVALLALSVGLVALQAVVLKMLPFDNKSEFQVVVDLPEGGSLERTNQLLLELAAALDAVPEVRDYQGYAGTSAPVNFNGLVRQYYLREGPLVGDLQVNLVDRRERDRKSHDIVRALRPRLAEIGTRFGASVKLVEVPPGPPVLAPLVAEIYGPDADTRRAIARELQARFEATEGIVDVDSTLEHAGAARDRVRIDRVRAARLGISQQAITDLLTTALSGRDVTYLRDVDSKDPTPLRLRLPAADQADLDALLALQVRSASGRMVPLAELVEVEPAPWDAAIHHKDLLPVSYVTADEAGRHDSPLYGMFTLVDALHDTDVAGQRLEQWFFSPPPLANDFAVKWDGEWQITFETFRDMGIAYAAGMLLIYLLVVAQFRSYAVPLVIMAPIPLTAIGVMPGHALLGAQFTATSMIGMIALAGIIVRNSILLVDFIEAATARGRALEDAVVEACAVRAQPIVLTALAAIGGALFILDDPIFNGLAIALIFGILVSTALTLLVIPLLYYALQHGRPAAAT